MRILLALILTLCSINAWAVTDIPISRKWQNAGFGGGGTYPMIVADNTTANKIYMVSDVAGNFYSDDAGDDWKFMNNGTTTIINASIAQSETDPNILYSLGKKLIKSVDGGKSWNTLASYVGSRSSSGVYKVIAIGKTDPNLVFVGLNNGKIMRTSNGGVSFSEFATPFGTNIRPTFLYIDPTDTYLIVGGQSNYGMIKYLISDASSSVIAPTGTNASYNWDFGTYNDGVDDFFCVTAGWRIACSSDLGENWSYTEDSSADSNYVINRFAVVRLSSTEIRYVIHLRQISTQYGTVYDYVSSDSGDTWTYVSDNITRDLTVNPQGIWADFGNIGNVFSIVSDPFDEDQFWITTDGTIWRSNDGGVNWVEKAHGAQNQVISDVACGPRMTSGITRCFQVGMDVGILYSDDVGDTWVSAFPNTSNGAPQGFAVAGHIWRVVTLGSQAEWDAGTGQVVATTSNWADFIPRIIRSTDNGVTWTIITSGLPTTQLNGTGEPHQAGWGIGYPRALAKCPSNDDILALGIDGFSATENGGIFISTDGGVTWTRTTQPEEWKTYNGIAFDPTDVTCNTIVFAQFFGSSSYLPKTRRTTDRGNTWTAVETDIGVFDLAFGSDGVAYKTGLDTNPMIDRSTNGINWESMEKLNTTNQLADGLWIDVNNANRICVGVNDGANTGTSQGSGSDASGDGAGSIYCTADANNGASATWYHLTGDLPSPGGVTAITMVYNYNGHDWLLIGTDGAGTFRLRADDSMRATWSNVRFQ